MQILPILAAIGTALFYATDNITDKIFTTHTVKNEYAYLALTGLLEVVVGLVAWFFLDWNSVNAQNIWFPILAGIFFASQGYLWITLLKKHDTTNLIGFIYTYPLLMIPLSYFVFGDKLSLAGIFAVIMIVAGIMIISLRIRNTSKYFGLVFLLPMIIVTAITEIFIKTSTNNMPFLNSAVITVLTTGLLYSGNILFSKKSRNEFIKNINKTRVLIFGEISDIGGLFLLVYATSKLPVTIVAAITCIQPLFVLILEQVAHKTFGKMVKDKTIIWKLTGVTFIIAGLIVLTLRELI